MLKIELSGCDTATCGEFTMKNKNGPIGKLARKMIEGGVEGDALCEVWRNGTLCFHNARVAYWADTSVAESDRVSVRKVPYVPFSAPAVDDTARIDAFA